MITPMHSSVTYISQLNFYKIAVIGLFVLLSVVATTPSFAQSPVAFDESILEIKTSRDIIAIDVEMAISPQQKSYGLMYRKSMPENHGMLFVYSPPQIATMWMKNTYIPLDMLFIRADGVIENIIQRTVPHSLDVLSATGKVIGVLELNAGSVTKLGIKAGDTITHEVFNNKAN